MSETELAPWLRQRIRERLYLATHAVELGSFAEWEERSSGVLVTGDGTDSDPWRGTWVTGDSSVTRLMEANDPRDTIARCEFELAVLDLHDGEPLETDLPDGDYRVRQVCTRCDDGYWPCRTVRLLGYSYRHWRGYREEWRP